MAKAKVEEWLADERLVILEGWARDGLTDEQIAENMAISVRTLYRWKDQYCQICQALKKGKDADREIENALFKRAKGYDFVETRIKKKDGVMVEETVIKKHIPGDTTAQIFWLKNRKPECRNGGNQFTSGEDLCTVGRQDGGFVERDTKRIFRMEAFRFIANACNKARIFISENETVEE